MVWLSPSSPEPYNGRGISYVAQGDDDNAFSDFNTAINLNGKVAESWANQALIYERKGDKVNIECDIIGKYAARAMELRRAQ